MNYPGLRLNVDRVHAGELGLSQKEVIDNVITALNSNYMIAPNYWVDYKTGNDYYLTVQYYETGGSAIHNFAGLEQHTAARAGPEGTHHAGHGCQAGSHSNTHRIRSLCQIQRVSDVYVTPSGEDLGNAEDPIGKIIAGRENPG